jgi:hypothetical protein
MDYSQSPWKTGKNEHNKAIVYDAKGHMIADCSIFSEHITDKQNNTNARLIKYAPDMYKLLQKVIALVSDGIAVKGDCIELIEKINKGK